MHWSGIQFFTKWALLCWLLLVGTPDRVDAQPVGKAAQAGGYDTTAPATDERCLICNKPLAEDDIVLLVRGRRVPLKRAMVDSFLHNQEKYFGSLQPKSALFQEEMGAPAGASLSGISYGWFVFGLYVLVALIFAGLSANAAVAKGLSPLSSFFIGLSLTAFGFLYVVTRPPAADAGESPRGLRKVPNTAAPLLCPKCKQSNHPCAASCSSCGYELSPTRESEVTRLR